MQVTVIGAGLAGSEAAWQLAQRGLCVRLCEMKPEKKIPAHESEYFAELCCSNSLRSDQLENAVGLLKEELRRLDSLILRCADATRVPAGGALAVDRRGFAKMVTEAVCSHPNIEVVPGEVTEIPEGEVLIATGPLTSDAFAEKLLDLLGRENTTLNFFDAAAPLLSFESVDMDSAYFASRYDKGTPDYINCPMEKDEYLAFWKALTEAEEAPVHGFEDGQVFEGCMPVEVMARRGEDTLRYGPLKPRGLKDPKTGRESYAVVQLRKDNADGSIYNLVGFQTHHDPRPEGCAVFALRGHAPQHLFGLSPAAGPLLPAENPAPPCLCRADDRSGGLCGVLRQRIFSRGGDGPPAQGAAAPGLPPRDGHRGPGAVCEQRKRGSFPAYEHQFRDYPAS